MMNYRMIAGVLLVLYLAGLTACTNRSTLADPAHLDPTDPPACNAACVTLTDTKIESSRVTFTAGEPYYFVVTNEGKVPSNFIITAEPQILNPGSQYNPILYISSTIPPGASRNFTFAFPITAPQGAVEFATTLVDPGGPGVLLPVQVELG
jgi:hypothetical protein